MIEILPAVLYFGVDSSNKSFLTGSLSLSKLVFVLFEVLDGFNFQAIAGGNYIFESKVDSNLLVLDWPAKVCKFTGEV